MASSEATPYEILNVPEDVHFVKLRKVYRKKIHEHLQKKISANKFRCICRAYETLSGINKRKQYDETKQWISELPIDKYTSQQLAAEPDLIRHLKQRLSNANLTTINAQDPITGHTTLYCAARAGNLKAVKFLTEHGAEPDLSQRTRSTALHAASFFGHADVVRCLLESGADYRIVNSCDNTAEEEANNGDVEQVFDEMKENAYVRVAANELDWFRTNGLTQHQDTEYFSQRQTLLHCASKKGYFDMVCWLVEQQSANIDLVDYNGNSALHLACYGGHREIVEYLLNKGCDPTLKNRWGTTAEEEGSKHGRRITALFRSMYVRDMYKMALEGVDWWFYYYFDVNLKDSSDSKGISLLYYACRYGHHSIAKWLLEHGANINIQMKDSPRSTPLHVAKYRGHLSVVELLLEYGADVNIRNDLGYTVFTDVIHDGVDKNTAKAIEEVLQQYKRNLKSDKLLDVHIYDDDDNGQEPVLKLKLPLDAGDKQLLEALSNVSSNQYPYFSIARRLLQFNEKDPTIISAVCRARYTCSKFIETPIRLIRHKTVPEQCKNQQSRSSGPAFNTRYFDQQLSRQGKGTTFSLKVPLKEKKSIHIDDLMFTFSENSITDDIQFKVTTLFSPDLQTFGIPGCICLFKTELFSDTPKLIELPIVSMTNDPEARLYTLATPTSYWFSCKTRKTRQPMIIGHHAFVRQVDIIPGQLSLPADMFLAGMLSQPLEVRDKPIPCTCLIIRKRDKSTFPLTAYHGTNIKAVQSILLDGLVIPGTVVSSGLRIQPPSNHFARDAMYFGVTDFAAGIFLSPSIYYSSDRTYATPFSDNDRQLIPVLECGVKHDSYDTYPSTISRYTAHESDDVDAIEWRVQDPANVEIMAVLFITKLDSIAASKEERLVRTELSTDAN